MTNQRKIIKIAETCGWRCIQESDYKPFGKAYLVGYNPDGSENLQKLPDYFNDLNAMHEAEKVIEYMPDYLFFLREVVGPFPDAESEWNDSWWQDVVRATASQRAEAFLKVKDLI